MMLALSVLIPAADASPSIPELKCLAALPIEGSAGLDLSGLALRGKTLHAISDKKNTTIYRISLDTGLTSARLEPAVTIQLPAADAKKRMDWEGLCGAPDGRWLLASEEQARVLAVPARGGMGTWLTPPLFKSAAEHGMLAVPNAGLEGIAAAPDGTLYLAAERQPRGLIIIPPQAAPAFFPLSTSIARVTVPRFPDLADLAWTPRGLLGVYRNAECLVRLQNLSGRWRETDAWSFRQTVRRPDLRYIAATFGMAEGLALDRSRIYLCVDNNRSGRAIDRADRRSLLLIFERPADL